MSITNQVQVVGIGAWLDDAGSVGATHTEAECCSIWAQTQEPFQVLLLQHFAYNVCGRVSCAQPMLTML